MSRTRTVAYLRASTEKQADKGVSLDAKANFLEVREVRETLRKIAGTHPELIGDPSPQNERDWRSAPAENEMGKTVQVAFRLEEDLVKRLDRYAKQMQREMPGFNISRTDAVRILLIRALANVKSGHTNKKPG